MRHLYFLSIFLLCFHSCMPEPNECDGAAANASYFNKAKQWNFKTMHITYRKGQDTTLSDIGIISFQDVPQNGLSVLGVYPVLNRIDTFNCNFYCATPAHYSSPGNNSVDIRFNVYQLADTAKYYYGRGRVDFSTNKLYIKGSFDYGYFYNYDTTKNQPSEYEILFTR